MVADLAHAELDTQSVRYELRLAAGEYAIVHSSVTTGVTKYGGDARYSLRAVRSEPTPSELQWIMTIEDARLMDALSVWAAETTTTLLASVDVNGLDNVSRDALRAMQSVNAKLAQSRANPIWEEQSVSALVVVREGTIGLRVGGTFLKATGVHREELQAYVGTSVIARGFAKLPGEYEVSSFTPRKDNTLELVLMSECPFGMRAADAVLKLVNSTKSELAVQPKVELRYLFYKRHDATSTDDTW
ncbi:MAG TPA: hypothetical protein VK157_04875, partial [Phycisphaerales bacterium]|nr:hypothetical protein [Phycisphaerales bacterium]